MKDLYRYSSALLMFVTCWISGAAFGSWLGFPIGLFLGYLLLAYANIRLPLLHWEKLREFRVRLLLALLAVSHIFAGIIIGLALPDYLLLFLGIGGAHIGLELWAILQREPKDPSKKKPIRYSMRKSRWRERYSTKEGYNKGF